MKPGRWLVGMIGVMATASGGTAQTDAPVDRPFQILAGGFVAIRVAEISEAAKWYERVFGLREVNRLEAEDGSYAIRILSGSGLTVELLREGDLGPHAEPSLGLFKVGFYVDDLERARDWLLRHDVSMEGSVVHDQALDARTLVFRDPWGNRLQLFQRCAGACDA